MIAEILGFAGSLISFVLWLPQARATYRARHDAPILAALSAGTPALVVANATIWGMYALLTGAFWVGAPGIVNGPLAIWTLWLIWRARHQVRSTADTAHATPEPHPAPTP